MNFFQRFEQNPLEQGIYVGLLLISVLLHEYGHAWAALLMGDDSNTHRGRFVWDPRKYINWLGFALFLLIGFGPLGQAAINPGKYRNRFLGGVLVSSGGVLMNLTLAIAAGLALRNLGVKSDGLGQLSGGLGQADWLLNALIHLLELNVVLFVFNLIPIPPLDGSQLLATLAPASLGAGLKSFQANSGYLLMVLILLLQQPLGRMLNRSIDLAFAWLLH